MVEAKNLSKEVDGRFLIDNFSFTLEPGSIVGKKRKVISIVKEEIEG